MARMDASLAAALARGFPASKLKLGLTWWSLGKPS